jgi:coenzyme F420-0:L-glutamate ligase / coenzyme F420-1:gamma-L-glutamate ligase
MNDIHVLPVRGIPEIETGDDLGRIICDALADLVVAQDVVVVAQKIVSKAEGRRVPAADRRDAAIAESAQILRRAGDMIISETRHGFVCANAGVDASNVPRDEVLLLPVDPDLSARRIRGAIERRLGTPVGVVVADTFGRAWRLGQTNVAIGIAGFDPFVDYRGRLDASGRELTATRICVADEIAAAAEMVMGKASDIPVAIVRGAPVSWGRGSARAIVRPHGEDLFR